MARSPTLDPTLNVKELNEASARHETKMREELAKRLDQALDHLGKTIALNNEHARESRQSEAKRLDAVRESDSLNARIVADRQATTLDTLIRKMAEDREALRASVEGTARTLALQLDSKMTGTEGRLLALERSLSEARGKEGVLDPQLTQLASVVNEMARVQNLGAGKSAGLSMGWAYLIGLAGLIGTLIGIFSSLSK